MRHGRDYAFRLFSYGKICDLTKENYSIKNMQLKKRKLKQIVFLNNLKAKRATKLDD